VESRRGKSGRILMVGKGGHEEEETLTPLNRLGVGWGGGGGGVDMQ